MSSPTSEARELPGFGLMGKMAACVFISLSGSNTGGPIKGQDYDRNRETELKDEKGLKSRGEGPEFSAGHVH